MSLKSDLRATNDRNGVVPLVIVFTKYDDLVTKVEYEVLDTSGLSNEAETIGLTKREIEKQFQALCMDPLQIICKKLKRKVPPSTRASG